MNDFNRNSNRILIILLTFGFKLSFATNCLQVDSLIHVKKKTQVCFSFNGGISNPFGEYGYPPKATSNSLPVESNTIYNGYASSGPIFNATADVLLRNGWNITFIGSYIHNDFGAVDFFEQTLSFDEKVWLGSTIYELGYGAVPVITTNYYYTHYIALLGVTKKHEYAKIMSIDYRILFGCMQFNFPDTKGTLPGFSDDTLTHQIYNGTFSWHIYGAQYYLFTMNIGLKIGVRILPHLYTYLNMDYIDSNVPYRMLSQVMDQNGNIIESTYINSSTNISMFTTTLGFEYRL
ncbi:MAG: hypothetical protein ACLQQ4_10000 [Bacteroidia bacterium]